MADNRTPADKIQANLDAELSAIESLKAELEQLRNLRQDVTEQTLELNEAEVNAIKLKLDLAKVTGATNERLAELRAELREAAQNANAFRDSVDAAREAKERLGGASRSLAEDLAGMIPIIGGNVDYMDTMGGKLAQASVNAGSLGGGISALAGDFSALMNTTQVSTNIMAASTEALFAYAAATVSLAVSVQETMAEFNKATGMLGSYNEQIGEAVRATVSAGSSFQQTAEAFQSFIETTSRFTDMNVHTQQSLAQTSIVLDKLGVDASTSAENVQIMTTSLNMTGLEAEETSRRLLSAAQQIGVAPAKMASDFAAAGGQFASFGEKAVDAFLDLSEVAKKTGIELQSLLSITEKFTTFEGAADQVGRLNAILGGPFLNTIDLVTLSLEDPAAAMMEVRNAVLEAGLSFDDMNPAMRRAVAAAAGLEDAGQLAALMSGDLESLGLASSATALQLEELKEQTKFTQTLAEEIEATKLAFMANFAPLIDNLIIPMLDGLQALAEFLGPIGAPLLAIGTLIGAAVGSFILLKGSLVAATAPVVALTGAMTTLNGTIATLGVEAPLAGEALGTMGATAAPAGPALLEIGAAVLMIGAGIGLAAAGLAAFVYSFSFLTGEQLFTAAAGLVALGLGFAALVSSLLFFSNPAGGVAIGALLAVGAAVLMIASAISIAAAGMSLLIQSIGSLADTADDFERIGTAFENMSIPKLVTYTAAMSATALVGATPAGLVIAAAAATAGGTGGGTTAPPPPAPKVEVTLQGDMAKLFTAITKYTDPRYIRNPNNKTGKL